MHVFCNRKEIPSTSRVEKSKRIGRWWLFDGVTESTLELSTSIFLLYEEVINTSSYIGMSIFHLGFPGFSMRSILTDNLANATRLTKEVRSVYLREAFGFGNSLVLFNQPVIRLGKLWRKTQLIAGSSATKDNNL